MIGKEDVEQASSFGLLTELMNQRGGSPSILSDLRLVDSLRWNALRLNPIPDLLNHLNGLRPQLGLHPWREAIERGVVLHRDAHSCRNWKLMIGNAKREVIEDATSKFR